MAVYIGMQAIETERLKLEPWHERWLEEFVSMAADQQVVRYVGLGIPWTREDSEKFFMKMLDHWHLHGFGFRAMVERVGRRWLGFIELNYVGPGLEDVDEDEVEIGWWLVPSAWGHGLATEGARAVRDEAFDRVGLDRIIARYQAENAASRHVMEKLGMHYERDIVGRQDEPLRVYVLDRRAWLATVGERTSYRRG